MFSVGNVVNLAIVNAKILYSKFLKDTPPHPEWLQPYGVPSQGNGSASRWTYIHKIQNGEKREGLAATITIVLIAN
jgi:hypothetical protein